MYSSVFFLKQKTTYQIRISYWSSDVCSSDLIQVKKSHSGAAKKTGICRQGLSAVNPCLSGGHRARTVRRTQAVGTMSVSETIGNSKRCETRRDERKRRPTCPAGRRGIHLAPRC